MENTFFFWLPPATNLQIDGPDAASYLQGQFSNDLRGLNDDKVVYGLWLNHKGRVLADSFVFTESGDAFRVVSTTSPARTIIERLESCIIADDVSVIDRTSGSGLGVVAGDLAATVLRQMGVSPPAAGSLVRAEGAVIARSRSVGRLDAWNLWVDTDSAETVRTRLLAAAETVGASEVAPESAAARRIFDGVPEIPLELGPGDLPQEGGLDAESVSFTKGCYAGQEVVARLRNLGQVRRRLFVVRWQEPIQPASLPLSLHWQDRKVGELRSLAPFASGFTGLAMLQTAHAQPGLKLAPAQGGPESIEVVRMAEGRAW
jgi:hypothetical protein